MKAPEFWTKGGLISDLLLPLGLVTRALTAARVRQAGTRIGIPVFCAGNASVGGSGKTILARDLLRRLPGRPFGLTRGYGGSLIGPILVDPDQHSPAEVGDEALLLAVTAPTILAHDRAAGATLAQQLGATSVVMDDGLQNPSLVKNAAFLVVDGGYGFGNGRLLPAGPLREPVAAAASRCAAAVVIGEDKFNVAGQLPGGLPLLHARLTPACGNLAAGARVIPFAGIGRPEKFFDSAAELGLVIAAKMAFADHHVYTHTDEVILLTAARAHQAQLVTTEKDYVKLPASLREHCDVITVKLAWDDEAALARLIAHYCAARG
ncbi:MAG: tetraacyldisaccharide 4'-kinase [Acidocella sp. 20-57-95]|nr:MAG: tetraacyldisaccharide 4'-kinase [Acidocella sp. 20-57-95]OYV58282.1 MAG: tetraacyldisaccharide 4'-kinase [Acidocella sp. 21-58-7]HQT63588.1 tetraacyldisaccharide 4'-kinase [Acidocella sp.]HQU05036.1 tetraacyldisaccharide 4'-kinase [Acidocella sp.]